MAEEIPNPEAAPFKEVTSEHVINFFTHNIIYRFGVPRHVISDNGTAFKSTKIFKFVERHKIYWRYSSIYNPRANGLAEAFNKTLVKLLKKILTKNKREWHTKMVEALWAYRTTYKTLTKTTPYSLMFGVEAVLPLEIELPSLRVAIQYDLTQEQNARLRTEELDALDEVRLLAQQNLEIYRARMTKSFDRMEGSFVIEKVYLGGTYQLIDLEGQRPMPPINGRYLKNGLGIHHRLVQSMVAMLLPPSETITLTMPHLYISLFGHRLLDVPPETPHASCNICYLSTHLRRTLTVSPQCRCTPVELVMGDISCRPSSEKSML
ncbi:uncharacterized protein LOC110112261 [Dendrobium catenatum]|uniref:uncharacterized protein LOC110112261 n=1 Tax=Dendrobium catenatum TaxID=906689 RepID=UPI00109F074D|nr:uncharacterized protein LOC110112261 [Dendrobium catenatum]